MTTLKRTARLTGLAYLGLAVSGALGFILIREQLYYAPGDAVATAANLAGHAALARFGIAVDLTIVLTQALAAVGFFTLFRRVHAAAAGVIAAFGLVNAAIILVATACTATALEVVLADAGSQGDSAATAQLLYELSGAAWDVGGLFFGLWLIPMGWAAVRSGSMPRLLGWVLMGGGVGYIVGVYAHYLLPGLPGLAGALAVPASVGELWMIGYLLRTGVRRTTAVPACDVVPVEAAASWGPSDSRIAISDGDPAVLDGCCGSACAGCARRTGWAGAPSGES